MLNRKIAGIFRATLSFLIAGTVAGCGPAPVSPTSTPTGPATQTPIPPTATIPATIVSSPTAAVQVAGYEFPTSIEPGNRYLFYLHGRIIEEQGLPAIDPVYGEYEYASILKALADKGFVVIGEQRPRNADAFAYARKVLGQVTDLLDAGVPPENITVVGASKGASIAATVSYRLDNPAVNYVLLGSCHPDMIAAWKSNALWLHGNVLAIYDSADDEYSGSCEELFRMSEGRGLGRHQEIVLHVGTGHGILYKPLPEWIEPTAAWAAQ